jgi:hypothetical protein
MDVLRGWAVNGGVHGEEAAGDEASPRECGCGDEQSFGLTQNEKPPGDDRGKAATPQICRGDILQVRPAPTRPPQRRDCGFTAHIEEGGPYD